MYHTQLRPNRLLSLLLLWLLMAFVGTTRTASAASFTIGCNDVNGLISAINSANGNGQADTINLAAGCTYTFTSANNSSDGNNALPSISSEITLVGNGATLAVNNQSALTRVFHIAASGVLTIQHASLVNGLGDGYAFLNKGSVGLISSSVSNLANSLPGGRAINNSGTLLIDQSTITDNGEGGIITSGVMTVTRSFFQNNHAADGGAIFVDSGAQVWIGNSTFADNSADTFSGALVTSINSVTKPVVSIFNSTFVGNTAFRAGALSGFKATVTVRNSLFANNTGAAGSCERITSAGNNISDEDSCGTDSGNLRLSPLGNYGGTTKTYLPGSGSPAIGAGDAATCANPPVNAIDQRGVARPQGTACESGAVEANVIVTPTLLGTVVQNNAYPTTLFSASGGNGPYSYVMTGTLPAGMSFVNKTLSGTPSEVGDFPICVLATDSSGMAGASCDTLVVSIQPVLAIGDVSVTEGNAGSVSVLFPVTLNVANATTITVNFASSNGSNPANAATAGSDYGSVSGKLTFAPGETSQTITVTVNGDATHEADEHFQVTLSGAVGAPITKNVGSGVIVNDDAPAGALSAACNIASLIAAINTANLDKLADTINLAANCSYTITSADNTTSDGANGLPAITSEMTIVGHGATIAVNNPVTSTRIFYLSAGNHLTLQNMTLADGKGDGGAVWSQGSLTVISSTLRNHNHSAIRTVLGSDTLIVDQSSFIDNRGAENGGAIHTHGVVTITRSLFLNNQATTGGGIFASSGAVMNIGNSTFSGNSTVNNGEGAALAVIRDFSNPAHVSIVNSTLVENSAFVGSAITAIGGTVNVRNSIIANNVGSITCFGTNSDGNNLSSDSDCVGSSGDISNTNPLLMPLGNYGGPTQSYLPVATSPAINAGNTVGCLSAIVNGVDQRGVIRPQGNGCDIGAVEANVSVTPTALTPADQGVSFPNTQFSASGGSAPYTYEITGILPSGMNFANGTLAGTPNEPGNFPICVIARDSKGMAGTSCATLVVNSASRLSISDASVSEGNIGVTDLLFNVTLNVTNVTTITVNYATSGGTATEVDDYLPRSGTLVFAPGEDSKTINVLVTTDTDVEADETFSVTLSQPTNAIIQDGEATGTILNDDGISPTPQITIHDASVTEGNSGSLNLLLNVTLDVVSTNTITVKYATSDGSATAGSDYSSSSGTLTFAPGVTNQTISVPVMGDTQVENDETFSVTLSEPTNAAIQNGQATGTILNDDVAESTNQLYLPLITR